MGVLSGTLIAFCLLRVAFGSPSEGTDEEQIISQLNLFHKFFHHPNPEALFDQVFNPKSYFMPPGEKTKEGKEKITSRLRRFMKSVKEVYVRSTRVEIFGDISVQVCRYEQDGPNWEVLQTGKCFLVWKKDTQTQQWRNLINIWNTN